MLVARSEEEFRALPEHAYVSGPSWLYFAFDRSLRGFALWGSPSEDDVQALVGFWKREFSSPPHRVLADVSAVESMAPAAFDIITEFFARHVPELSKSVTRAVIVRPEGFNGALASGFFSAAPTPFEVSFCRDLQEAFAGLDSPTPVESAQALIEARAIEEGVPHLLRQLRVQLDGKLHDPTIEGSARALRVSVRTLQRTLSTLGTSYRAERQASQMRRAERLLVETTKPITNIGLEVGCSSAQHFSSLFRKHHEMTPSAFRRQKRRSG